ncbi:MAG: hypothetical protein V7K21_27445 [Nostoc sp.]
MTLVENKFTRGLLCGCRPAEIANGVYQNGSSNNDQLISDRFSILIHNCVGAAQPRHRLNT